MTTKFKFGKRSLANLVGIHPDMRAMTDLALELSEVDFAVTCGLRTPEQQAEALRTGASTTKKSRHLVGCAVDVVACLPGGGISYARPLMNKIHDAFAEAAARLKLPYRWGGDWDGNPATAHTLYDSPHHEIPRSRRHP